MAEQGLVSQSKRLSSIWLIPLLALAIGLWMVVQHYMSMGTHIHLHMPHAEGLLANKTEIRVRSVRIGTLTQIQLAEDTKSVIARANIMAQYTHLLTSDAQMWVVKPRIDESGISGMNTLLSGAYIEFSPGESSEPSRRFTLLDNPALISKDIPGKRFNLIADDAEVVEVGSRILYQGYAIGQVETADFDWQNQSMRYGIFIKSPYDNLIKLNSIFWVSSGVEFDLNVDGVSVRTGSLSKLLKGGISVGLPTGAKAGPTADDKTNFILSPDFKTAMDQRFFDYAYYVILFEQSIRGLKPGAPVEYRGIRVGSVVEAPAMLLQDGRPAHFSTESTAVPVLIKVEYGRLFHDSGIAKEFWQSNYQSWLDKGLRASLKPGNLLTGAIYVDLDIYPDAEPYDAALAFADYPVFPSVSSGFTVIADQVSHVLSKIEQLALDDTVTELNNTLASIRQSAEQITRLMAQPDTQALPGQFNQNMTRMTQAMAQFDQTMVQFERTLATYEADSPLHRDVSLLIKQLKQLSDSLAPMSKGLNEQPNMLIFDKKLPADPIPKGASR